ncbi:MAG: hypothetical protein RR869_10570 [Lachnospiraceae bacterium]
MKRVKKIVVGIIMGLFFLFVTTISLGVLIEKGVLKTREERPSVTMEYTPQNIAGMIDEEKISDSNYYDSIDKALKNNNTIEDEENCYKKKIDEIIKRFENDNYVTLYFKSVKNKNVECLTFAKFKKKEIEGKVGYTFISSIPTETERGIPTVGGVESLIESQLALSDYMQNVNIDSENTRFVFGDCKSDKIFNLEVEGQKPSEIIPYESFGEQWYFWYYENLESNKVGNELKFRLE